MTDHSSTEDGTTGDDAPQTLLVHDVVHFLDELAPLDLAEDWDNVGLLVGDAHAEVSRVVTCLTLTPDVATEAIEERANLVVSHHPVLFRAVKRLTTATEDGRMLLALVRAGIAVHSSHTAYDSASAGINQQLCEAFGLGNVLPIRPESELSTDVGTGRYGELSESESLARFVERISTASGLARLQLVGEDDRAVHRVAVACGSAGEFLADAARLGCDTFVTGEARFHTCLEARSLGIALVLLGHYASERPAVETLADRLAERFPGLTAWASRVERDPLRWS